MIVKAVLCIVIGLNILKNILLMITNKKQMKKSLPSNVSNVYEKEEYTKWLTYYNSNLKVGSIKTIVTTLIEITLLLSGFYLMLYKWLINIGVTYEILNAIVLILITSLIDVIIATPFNYYNTFVIEEKYGFNKTTKSLFFKDLIRNFIMTSVLFSFILFSLLSLYVEIGVMLIVYGVLFVFIILFIIMLLYGKVFSKISNKQTPLETGELRNAIEDFALKVDFNVADIFVMDGSKRSTKGNAYCSGFSKFKRIVLFDTLIEQLSTEEIVAVVAHEVGHSKLKHSIKSLPMMIINLFILIGGLFLCLETKELCLAFGFDNISYGFTIILFLMLISPISIISNIISNIGSRRNEYQADNYAAINYSKEHLITGLKKIHSKNFSNINPTKLNVILNYSHPPLTKRLEALEKGD